MSLSATASSRMRRQRRLEGAKASSSDIRTKRPSPVDTTFPTADRTEFPSFSGKTRSSSRGTKNFVTPTSSPLRGGRHHDRDYQTQYQSPGAGLSPGSVRSEVATSNGRYQQLKTSHSFGHPSSNSFMTDPGETLNDRDQTIPVRSLALVDNNARSNKKNAENNPASRQYFPLQVSQRSLRPPIGPAASFDSGCDLLVSRPHEDDLSSLEGVEDSHSLNQRNLQLIASAIQNNSNRPPRLSKEEKALWDAVQSVLATNRAEVMAKQRQMERQVKDMTAKNEKLRQQQQELVVKMSQEKIQESASSSEDDSALKEKYAEAKKAMKEQQEEHERSLRAIQRVLADVTTEKDELLEKHNAKVSSLNEQHSSVVKDLRGKIASIEGDQKASLEKLTQQQGNHVMQRDYEEMKEKLAFLEEQNSRLKHDLEGARKKSTNSDGSKLALQRLQEEHDAYKAKHADSIKDTAELKERLEQGESQIATLKTELQERTSSLENAKMIITSLEHANGSQARELRAKVKEKEDEVLALQNTGAERKRTLDSLATELRELQRKQGKTESREQKHRKQFAHQRELCQMLEKNLKGLRQAAINHEARNNQSSVDAISQIVSETFSSMKTSLESWEAYFQDAEHDSPEVWYEVKSESKNAGATELRQALSQKVHAINQLEQSLTKQREEVAALRGQIDSQRKDSELEKSRMQTEIDSLRDQCKTNMEVLAKKGQELSVLRDSLKVDDDVGYISDDNTEGYETEMEGTPPPHQMHYDASKAEALATLLGHSGPNLHDSAIMIDEIKLLKQELSQAHKEKEVRTRQLQSEKESLANAKMIISSLEKANKSMLEDLRSRLQDSNTAIASLLEKSIENEKASSALKKELSRLKHQKDEDDKKRKAEIAKLQRENHSFSMTIRKLQSSSVEEKKEEPILS